ncbi:ABC transporter substrate-binding protein [Paenibacillus qinlingensis]|uniref:Aldouronate transport system substrate-binding protein n=1 Tax=Paenibacillus qinlingensis TaxID=1837343 RepID=A0ABU1NP67_9BACL|nr:ABC transporter substrate-binding protein [Paenibacillus qinlingensis]MDR6549260.1 putative aldouronate transport system substrate-binding protein [Paenibacillus qinlingensis]
MKKGKKMYLSSVAIMLLSMTVLAGCKTDTASETKSPTATTPATSTSATPATPAPSTLPEVKLTFYYPSNPPGKDQALVNEEVNKYVKSKINATVDLKPLSFDEYDPKLNTIMASGEAFDVAWGSKYWLLGYQPNIDKGALLELTDAMISKNAAQARKNIPDKFWPDMKATDGKVYGFPVYQIAAKTKSLVIQKQFVDKYKLDVNSIKTYKDLEPFLKTIKTNEKDVIPFGMAMNSWGLYTDPNLVNADGLAVAYKKDDKTYASITKIQQLLNKKDFYTTMHNWSKAGYINEDAPLVKNITDLKKKGKVAVSLEFTTKPGGEVDEMANNGNNPVVYVPISDSYFTGVASAMQVISKTSKNPERALMFINLLNTDKVLYNLISNGVEGKHYTKKDDKYIEPIKDSGYAPNVDWVFGNQFNAYLKGAQTADVWDKTIKLNESAMVPVSYGFDVNRDTIKSEVANVTAVDNEFQVALETGAVDPADQLQKYIDKLKAAGQDKIDAETTKQWQAFLKAKGL